MMDLRLWREPTRIVGIDVKEQLLEGKEEMGPTL